MNTWRRRLVVLGAFAGIYQSATAQQHTDGQFLFKTWLFMEHTNNQARLATAFPVKDSSVFSLFMNTVHLKLDTLSSTGFSDDYTFLALTLNYDGTKVNDSAIVYDKRTAFLEYVVVPVFCSRYVLCVNMQKGTSYRIQGFTGNDFLGLLKEVQEEYYRVNKAKLKANSFLKQHAVSGIDFKCIYKGLTSGEHDPKEYPCLGDCRNNEIIWVN